MATAREIKTKKGICYEIQVSRGRGKSPYSKRWYPPSTWDGWSIKKKQAELNRQKALFEEACLNGMVKTKAEVREELAKNTLSNKNIAFQNYCETIFLPYKSVTAATNTMEVWKACCKNHIYGEIGVMALKEITPMQITRLLLKMQEGGLKNSTIIKTYQLLILIFKTAYKQDLIVQNPMDKVDRPTPRKDEGKDNTVKSLSVEETNRLLGIMDNEPLKWNAYVRLMLDTGMRKGECCAVQWEDLDLERRQLIVRHTLNYTKSSGVVLEPPKNGKTRIVDYSEKTADLLRKIKEVQNATVQSAFVFAQEDSTCPIHPQSPTRYLNKLGKKYEFKNLHPHLLRHTHVSLGLLAGADVTSMSERIGHADPSFTLRQYSHTNTEGIIKAGECFRKALENKICENVRYLYAG